jgi:hypothetical protein
LKKAGVALFQKTAESFRAAGNNCLHHLPLLTEDRILLLILMPSLTENVGYFPGFCALCNLFCEHWTACAGHR